MTPCTGCRFYVVWNRDATAVCSAVDNDAPMQTTRNPYDERVIVRRGLRPKITDMRAQGGRCGPDAALRQEKWLKRLLGRITK